MVRFQEIRKVIGEKFKGDMLYAGVVGSCLVERRSDVDIIVIVRKELHPTLFHFPENISALAFDVSWLDYKKHEAQPIGLVPSILFKAL